MGGTLFQWFIYSLVVSVFAGYIAGVAFGPGTEYLRIFQVAGCVAFAGYGLAQMHVDLVGPPLELDGPESHRLPPLWPTDGRHVRMALAALK